MHLVKDGKIGLEQAMSQRHDVLVLDLLLPGESGLSLLEALRGAGIRIPVVVLTALGSVDDRVTGLTRGADDYLVKPFAMPELLARIEAVCRRSGTKPSPVLQVGDLALDLPTRRVTGGGVEIELTPTEFSILEMLMRHAGQVVTRKMLCEHLWKADWKDHQRHRGAHQPAAQQAAARHQGALDPHRPRTRLCASGDLEICFQLCASACSCG